VSVEVTDWIWKHSAASGNDLIVLLKIGDNANSDGGGAYPGIDYLARAARISKRAVYDCLRRLKASGELVEEAHGGGRGRKTTYRVLMEKGAASSPNPVGNGAAGRKETVQPAARNGADSGSAYKEEPSLNRPKNPPPPSSAVEPGTERPVTAQTLLDEHIQALGTTEPLLTAGRLGATLKGLLARRVQPDRLRSGLAYMRERNITQPSALPGILDQLANGNGHRVSNGHGPPQRPSPPEFNPAVAPPFKGPELAAFYGLDPQEVPS
jgi:hypothetical protein